MEQAVVVKSARGAVQEVFGSMIGLPISTGSVYTEERAAPETAGIPTAVFGRRGHARKVHMSTRYQYSDCATRARCNQ